MGGSTSDRAANNPFTRVRRAQARVEGGQHEQSCCNNPFTRVKLEIAKPVQ